MTRRISKARESWENKVAAVMPPLSFIHHKTHLSRLYLLTTARNHAPRNPNFKIQIHLDTIATPYTARHRLPATRQIPVRIRSSIQSHPRIDRNGKCDTNIG